MMDIDSDEETLRKLALGDSMDYSAWPLLLCEIIARIEKIARNDFPIPIFPAPTGPISPPEPRFLNPLPSSDPIGPSEPLKDESRTDRKKQKGKEQSEISPSSSQETNKENANPAAEAPAIAAAPANSELAVRQSLNPESEGGSSGPSQQRRSLPPQISAQLVEITSTLTKEFPSHPPHTIQRLAELVLRPRQHYRSLPSYLHAVDRVVHVASGSNIFPLPPAVPDPRAMAALANGVVGAGRRPASSSAASASPASTASVHPGSDEALGGALLTPIPWLIRRAESVDGADAALSPEPDAMVDADGGLGEEAGGGAAGGAGSQQARGGQHQGGGRQRQQQRLSTESTETIEGPNGVGHIETVSVSVNGVVSHGSGTAMAAAMARGGGSGGAPSSSPSSSPSASVTLSSVGGDGQGVTQGELIREEQRQGVIPASQADRNAATAATAGTATSSANGDRGTDDDDDKMEDASASEGSGGDGEDEEGAPHLRGPKEIGLADTGPQADGTTIPAPGESAPSVDMSDLDVEAAVGRPADPASSPKDVDTDAESVTEGAPTPKREADIGGDPGEPPAKKQRGDERGAAVDAEGDVVIPDEEAAVAPGSSA